MQSVKLYKEILLKSKKAIDKKLSELKTKDEILFYLQNSLKEKLLEDENKIREEFNKIKCANCGVCCRIAVSEFSPKTLAGKAKSGDKTAKSFLQTFELYEGNKPPKDLVQSFFEDSTDVKLNENVYFYRCKKVKPKDGKYFCPIYAKRPDVCRNFPDTPLENLPKTCAYNIWKDENQIRALFIWGLNRIRKTYLTRLFKDE